MADKRFTIQDLLPLGISLKLPPFLGGSSQMPAEDVVKTQEIPSLRIHIKRAINKIKNFHIWDKVIPLHQIPLANQRWAVCAVDIGEGFWHISTCPTFNRKFKLKIAISYF